MKKATKSLSIILSTLLIAGITSISISKPMDVYGDTLAAQATKEELAAKILGSKVTAESITFTGNPAQGAVFSGASFLPFSDGIILSSGNASSVFGPESKELSTDYGNPGDPDLNQIIKNLGLEPEPETEFETNDAACLEFTITPKSNKLLFSYILASDEDSDSIYANDPFAIFVGGKNVALIPETNTPASIFSAFNNSYYIDNQGGANLGFLGFTKELTCTADVAPGIPIKIKIAMADIGDHDVDTAVFIKAIDFAPVLSNVTLSGNVGDDILGTSDKGGTLYLVPKGTYSDKAALEAAAGDKKTECKADTPASVNTSGLKAGTYQMYAVDSLGLLSLSSDDIVLTTDTKAPDFTVTGNPTNWTKDDVTLKIAASDDVSGLNNEGAYSFDGGKSWTKDNWKTFTENGTVIIKVRDNDGNISTKEVVIDKIDKIPPVITVKPYNMGDTSDSITVTVSTNEGTLNAESHIFTKNGSFDFIAEDAAGNKTVKTVTISNIITEVLPKTGYIMDFSLMSGLGMLLMMSGIFLMKKRKFNK